MDHNKIPIFPKIIARIESSQDGLSGTVKINGVSQPLKAIPDEEVNDLRGRIIAQIVDTSTKIGRPVKVTSHDLSGTWNLIVHPDGTVEADASQASTKPRSEPKAKVTTPVPVAVPSSAPVQPEPRKERAPLQNTATDRQQSLSQSARWWEEAINDHNRACGYLHPITLMRLTEDPSGPVSGSSALLVGGE